MAASLITTLGSVLAALGGIGMTQGIGARVERRKGERRQAEESLREHDRTCADLMAAARTLRLQVAVTARIGRCNDLGARLSAIQEQAAIVNQHASALALLASDELVAAGRDLAWQADELVGFVAAHSMIDRETGSDGVLEVDPDMTGIEGALKEFESLVRAAQAVGPSGSGRRMR